MGLCCGDRCQLFVIYCKFAPRRILALFRLYGRRRRGGNGGWHVGSTMEVGGSGGGENGACVDGFGVGVASSWWLRLLPLLFTKNEWSRCLNIHCVVGTTLTIGTCCNGSERQPRHYKKEKMRSKWEPGTIQNGAPGSSCRQMSPQFRRCFREAGVLIRE